MPFWPSLCVFGLQVSKKKAITKVAFLFANFGEE